MASEKRSTLTVVYAIKALKQLDEIWEWNQHSYGLEHADQYVEFLERSIDALGQEPGRGRQVDSRPDLRYMLIRRKSRGHGHVAVYKVKVDSIHILYVFHSAQDWPAIISKESEQS